MTIFLTRTHQSGHPTRMGLGTEICQARTYHERLRDEGVPYALGTS
jgi:hypothetical protein